MIAPKSFYTYQPAAHLLVTDEDSADFLQSQFSNQLRPFQSGQASYGLWLDVKGKVVADSVVLCEGEASFRVLSERCAGETIAAHMERHIIADDVEIEHAERGYALELSAEGVAAIGWELPEYGQFVRTGADSLFSVRKGAYTLLIDTESTFLALQAQLAEAGFAQLSEVERGLCRIAAGIPQVPDEIGAADLPGEGGLERDAISFTKGCYLGQEVVARMHNIGKPQRGLFVVRGVGAPPEVPLALHNSDSKQVGELRSAYQDADCWCGVAILKTRFAGVGESLNAAGDALKITRALREGTEHD